MIIDVTLGYFAFFKKETSLGNEVSFQCYYYFY